MVRTDYMVTLEELASLVYSAVSVASKENTDALDCVLLEIGRGRDKKICALEDSFCFFKIDFENNILAFSSALSGIIDASREYYFAARRATKKSVYENDEAMVCTLMAEHICRQTELLPYLNEEVDTDGFCILSQKGREAHEKLLRGMHANSNQRYYGHFVISSARLRRAIIFAFEELVKLRAKMSENA